jgi:hypothetical protein
MRYRPGKRVLTPKIRRRLYPWAFVAGALFISTQIPLLLAGSNEEGNIWEILVIATGLCAMPLFAELGDRLQAGPLNFFNWY